MGLNFGRINYTGKVSIIEAIDLYITHILLTIWLQINLLIIAQGAGEEGVGPGHFLRGIIWFSVVTEGEISRR